MKFKDKDGNVFVNIDFAWKLFCIQNQCEDCPIYEDRNGCALPCEDYVRAHPAEAARLMGYEVIEDEPASKTDKEVSMDKPFSNDWPEEWELEKPRFNSEEVEAAQWIQRIFPGMWDEVNCDKEGRVCLICRNGWEAAVNVAVFPSLRPGQTVKLSDILGGNNEAD